MGKAAAGANGAKPKAEEAAAPEPAAKRAARAKPVPTGPEPDAAPSSPADEPAPAPMALDAKTTRELTERLKRRPAAKPIVALAAAVAPPPTGVIYVGHLPHGFFEEQMRPFFEQFGVVTRLRVSRCKKTARSKGCLLYTSPSPRD